MRDIMDAINNGYISGNAIGKKVVVKQLQNAALYLKQLIEEYMKDYFATHSNQRYKRTHQLENSLVVGNVSVEMTPMGTTFCTYVRFNNNALHRSGFGVWGDSKGHGKYEEGNYNLGDNHVMNTALAVNYGYSVQQPVWFRDREKFGQREGAYFVEKAIDEFNRTNQYGIYIDKNTDIVVNPRP